MRTVRFTSSAEAAPRSTQRSVIFGIFLRSSSDRRCVGFLPMTPRCGPELGPHHHRAPEQDRQVPAADRLHVEEARVVDVLHHQADVVAVAVEQDARPAARVARRDHVAVEIGAHLVGVLAREVAHQRLHLLLVAGGLGVQQELVEERARALIDHAPSPSSSRGRAAA